MIRGVNKRIIEINDVGNDYFEKALFIVKDNKAAVPHLKSEAKKVVNTYFQNDKSAIGYLRQKSRTKKKVIFSLIILSLLIAGIVILLKLI